MGKLKESWKHFLVEIFLPENFNVPPYLAGHLLRAYGPQLSYQRAMVYDLCILRGSLMQSM